MSYPIGSIVRVTKRADHIGVVVRPDAVLWENDKAHPEKGVPFFQEMTEGIWAQVSLVMKPEDAAAYGLSLPSVWAPVVRE